MQITSAHPPLWLDIFWKILENAEVRFKGIWKLDAWNKFFSHAPLYSSSRTLNFLLRSFKSATSYLKWNGRQRYVGNSFASLSPYWSFLSNPPIAHLLGTEARYLNSKGIDSIGKCYDFKWDLLSFPLVRRKYSVGPAYRSAWVQLSRFLHQFQMPLSIDASDPWRDWLLAKHSRWWNGTANTFYYSFLLSDSIASQCNFRWNLQKHLPWWRSRFHSIWHSSLTFKMKIFMWRIFVGHFTLGAFLSKHDLQGARCPHCSSYAENMRHAFWRCQRIQGWWNTLFLFPIWERKPTKADCTFLLFDNENAISDWIRKRCVFLLLWNIWMLRNSKLFANKISIRNFSWKLCKAHLRLDIAAMPSVDRPAFISFLEAI
ncbi:hypothetical protein KP509_22G040400 [Ceratopteris richardii]|uniref:Reverse transcriptase zinc-binding domain-containing protein n=2 Tax=Ceratopteris richardii TaxID=49495 RepID=A0A8T2S4C9_CERRI|nr:hypothetical protein KP509_22G040400 [Ceratopteris richardii]